MRNSNKQAARSRGAQIMIADAESVLIFVGPPREIWMTRRRWPTSRRLSPPPGARPRTHIPQCNVESMDDVASIRGSVCHAAVHARSLAALSPRFVVVSLSLGTSCRGSGCDAPHASAPDRCDPHLNNLSTVSLWCRQHREQRDNLKGSTRLCNLPHFDWTTLAHSARTLAPSLSGNFVQTPPLMRWFRALTPP